MSKGADPVIVKLPEIMDLRAAAPLAREMLALRGVPVSLDASHVERLGGLCLQVLLSAQMTWRADNVALRVVAPSAPFLESAAAFGALPPSEARFA
jgi:chemotaxis protein CheX